MVGVDKMNQLMADHIGNTVERGLHQLPGKGHPPLVGEQLPQREVMDRTRISGIGTQRGPVGDGIGGTAAW